jgi:Protein of unknown function (DUF3631)
LTDDLARILRGTSTDPLPGDPYLKPATDEPSVPVSDRDPPPSPEMSAGGQAGDNGAEALHVGGDFSGELLDEVLGFLRRFVVLSDAQVVALTLWTLSTYVFESFECAPYLGITSAVKRSGKSRLLDVLELLVARPWRVVSPSEAVVYRKIARDRPTLLLDEVDTIFRRNGEGEPLRALLNAGNRRGTRVPRCAGAQRDKLEEFDVYCPKALAGIGKLPDTIADRSVPIELKRRAPGEPIERFRRRDADERAEIIRRNLVDWADQLDAPLAEARPELPDIDDRAADAWEPLLAIADWAGGEWPAQARAAALELSAGTDEDDSHGVRLLADAWAVFEQRKLERLPTAELLAALNDDDEAPWATWGKGDKPLTARGLWALLRPFKIKPDKWRDEALDKTVRGYRRRDFEDSWRRYPPQAPQRLNHGVFEDFASATDTLSVADKKAPICRDVPLVADESPETSEGA